MKPISPVTPRLGYTGRAGAVNAQGGSVDWINTCVE